MSIRSKIQALITAANTKTGESDTTLTDAVQTLVDGYGQGGGGGSLPSVISKIDGGSFTLASDTAGSGYDIPHTLGVVPKGFVIWTEDEISGTVATRHLGSCSLTAMNLVNKNAVTNVSGGVANILYNGSIAGIQVQLSDTVTLTYMNSERIRWNNNLIYYKAGATYKWLAWA